MNLQWIVLSVPSSSLPNAIDCIVTVRWSRFAWTYPCQLSSLLQDPHHCCRARAKASSLRKSQIEMWTLSIHSCPWEVCVGHSWEHTECMFVVLIIFCLKRAEEAEISIFVDIAAPSSFVPNILSRKSCWRNFVCSACSVCILCDSVHMSTSALVTYAVLQTLQHLNML